MTRRLKIGVIVRICVRPTITLGEERFYPSRGLDIHSHFLVGLADRETSDQSPLDRPVVNKLGHEVD